MFDKIASIFPFNKIAFSSELLLLKFPLLRVVDFVISFVAEYEVVFVLWLLLLLESLLNKNLLVINALLKVKNVVKIVSDKI